ncbi:MAG: O-antigen ligase family protein, partial [Chloroflexota bacterium]|nr:O-antigen ligase family protein [Chloroflexota bacterium]
QMFKRLALVVLMIGVAEAILGLLQYLLGLNAVLAWLRQPLSGWLFQPNLLAERLGDVAFNWVVFDRASPFGTFINGIDYAIFIAAILGLALATLIVERGRATETFALFVSVLLMGVALLLTFKGSGMIALAGAAATIALFYMPRPSPRVLVIGLTGLIVVFLLALPFADLIAQRAAFLLLREQGALGTAGRLDTWASLFDRFLQRPLFGYGLNHAALLTEPTRTLRAGTIAFNAPTAESAYVGALVETGAIGFGALMAWFALVAARAYRRIREDKRLIGILAALVALWLGNLTVAGFTTDQNGMLLGLFIGMVLGRWKNP